MYGAESPISHSFSCYGIGFVSFRFGLVMQLCSVNRTFRPGKGFQIAHSPFQSRFRLWQVLSVLERRM